MTLDINKVELGQVVEIIEPDLEERGYLLDESAIKVLKDCECKGKVTQIQDDLVYVAFVNKESDWVTQVFKVEELKEVK